MTFTRSPIALAVLLALVFVTGCHRPEEPLTTSVCSVREEPRRYRQKQVILAGRVVSDFIHSTVIADNRCPATAVALSFADGDPKASDLLRRLAREPKLAASLETSPIGVTVIGTFDILDGSFVLVDARVTELTVGATTPPNSTLQPTPPAASSS